MKSSCLVNNYNYAPFVVSAVESALSQTEPFDEIVVVDDGSTDDSIARLRDAFASTPTVRIVAKANAGQLSCFNAGLSHSTGDLLCFLDADDLYEPGYLAKLKQVYAESPQLDYVFSAHSEFDESTCRPRITGPDRDLGYSVIVTWCLKKWIGAPTSCVSMRRQLAEKILPIPYLSDWRTRADDCLVFGSSLVGGHKFYLAQPLVRYRRHEGNHFAGRKIDAGQKYRRKLALNRLFDYLVRRNGLNTDHLPEFAHREFQTLEHPTLRQMWEYLRIPFRSRVRWSRRFGIAASIAGYYLLGLQK